ncbi:MAG: hypothetical protein WB622_18545 [Acidobacteriaceae bacterium]
MSQPIGGFEELIENLSGEAGAPLLPGVRLYWCRRHQLQLEARTVVKPGRRLSAADIDAHDLPS